MLKDPKKREIYDKYGEEAIKEGMGNGPQRSAMDIFSGDAAQLAGHVLVHALGIESGFVAVAIVARGAAVREAQYFHPHGQACADHLTAALGLPSQISLVGAAGATRSRGART